MSYVLPVTEREDERFTFREAIDLLKGQLIGNELYQRYGDWPMYAKFFDYNTPLFHHLHLGEEAAARVGRLSKPEHYYFPRELNHHLGTFPVTYFGFDPSATKDQVRARLQQYELGDNRITELSRAFRMELGTGWYTAPGVVHAPASLLTYEPQWNSDVHSVYENVMHGEVIPYNFLVDYCPEAHQRDLDYVMSLMDWDKNVDPLYKQHYFRPPLPCGSTDAPASEEWIAYGNPYVGAIRLSIPPGATVTVRDPVAYGCILVQGFGQFGVHHAESIGMLRFGQQSADEFFVSEPAARQGVTILNRSRCEPMVWFKHFGPTHPEMPAAPAN